MMIVDAIGFFVDAVQRNLGLNIRFDDLVGAQLDISKDFSLFLLMIFVFLLMQCSIWCIFMILVDSCCPASPRDARRWSSSQANFWRIFFAANVF